IVGPRPCIAYEYEQYEDWQRNRLGSVPGLTGLWQVSGKNRTTFEEMVQLDIAYGEKRTLALDLWIILRTVPALWTQVSDTRKARAARAPARPPMTVPFGPKPLQPAVTVTFAGRTQNVLVGTSTARRSSSRPVG